MSSRVTDKMKAWISQTHSDEDGPMAIEGKSVIIYASKEEILAMSEFTAAVAKYLKTNDFCHMHLRDHMKNWNKALHIDIEINVEKTVSVATHKP